MSEQEVFTWQGEVVHQTEQVEDAAPLRNYRPRNSFVVTIGNTDLSAFVSDGVVYIQAPLTHIFEAFAEDISAFIRDLEVRISDAGGSSLSLDSDGRPVYGKAVAESRVVRGRRER
jgi:hypothetical protein